LDYDSIVLSLWVAYFLLVTLLVARPRPQVVPPPAAGDAPALAVLVPVRGYGPNAERFVDLLMAQDYPNFRVLLLVESATDPATRLMRRHGMAERASLVVGSETAVGAQKVANLLTGLAALRPSDRIVVFCDADSIPTLNWLTRLTQPLREGTAEVTTTFRLLIPKRPRWGSCNYAASDVAMALSPRPPQLHCWGGATAVLADRLPRLELPRRWRGVSTDDSVLSEGVKAAKLKGKVLQDLLMPSEIDFSASEARRFARRQLLIFTLYIPVSAVCFAAIGALPTLFWISAAIKLSNGAWLAPYAMAAVFSLDGLRAWLRWDAVRRVAGADAARRWRCAALIGWLLAAPRGIAYITTAIAAFSMREVTWAGIRYRIHGPRDVRVIARTPPSDRA